jgi:hypothetical protein
MELFDFYKETYYKELDKKDEINTSLAVPMSIASGMFAGLFFMSTTFCYKDHELSSIFFIAALSLSCLLLIISIFYLSQAYND